MAPVPAAYAPVRQNKTMRFSLALLSLAAIAALPAMAQASGPGWADNAPPAYYRPAPAYPPPPPPVEAYAPAGEVQRIVLPLDATYRGETLDLSRLASVSRRMEGWSVEGVEVRLHRDRNFGEVVLLQDGYAVDRDSTERRREVVLRPNGGGVIGETVHRLDLQVSGRAAIREVVLVVRAPWGGPGGGWAAPEPPPAVGWGPPPRPHRPWY